MPGVMVAPVLLEKIVLRASVAKARCPVDPTAAGCASAKYDDTASFAELLHVFDAGVTVAALVSAARLTT